MKRVYELGGRDSHLCPPPVYLTTYRYSHQAVLKDRNMRHTTGEQVGHKWSISYYNLHRDLR